MLALEQLRVAAVARDHEAGVVAGERPDDPLVLEPVQRPCDRRCRPELGLQHDDVLRSGDAAPELLEEPL
jgi:hypothetical protein